MVTEILSEYIHYAINIRFLNSLLERITEINHGTVFIIIVTVSGVRTLPRRTFPRRTHPRRTLPRRTLPRRTFLRPDTSPTDIFFYSLFDCNIFATCNFHLPSSLTLLTLISMLAKGSYF